MHAISDYFEKTNYSAVRRSGSQRSLRGQRFTTFVQVYLIEVGKVETSYIEIYNHLANEFGRL